MKTKQCCTCKEVKPLSEFFRSRGKPYAACKVCHTRRTNDWRNKHRTRVNERRMSLRKADPKRARSNYKNWREEHPEEYRASSRRNYHNHAESCKERSRTKHLAKVLVQHGMTLEEYETMLVIQDHRCAICHRTVEETKPRKFAAKRFAIDHDHATGKVRGLLCLDCNLGIGHFHDDPVLCESASVYLSRTL